MKGQKNILAKTNAYHGGASKRAPLMQRVMLPLFFFLFLFLFLGYLVSPASFAKESPRRSGQSNEAQVADQAERNLVTFDRVIGAALLTGGSIFAIYWLRRNGKTGGQRKMRGPASRRGRS